MNMSYLKYKRLISKTFRNNTLHWTSTISAECKLDFIYLRNKSYRFHSFIQRSIQSWLWKQEKYNSQQRSFFLLFWIIIETIQPTSITSDIEVRHWITVSLYPIDALYTATYTAILFLNLNPLFFCLIRHLKRHSRKTAYIFPGK